jgi:phage terminase large subunit
LSGLNFTAHSEKQNRVVFGKKRITIAGTGIQWGKTESGVIWLKMKMHEFSDPLDNFLVTSPTYKILYQSTLPPFMKWNEGLGYYDKKNEAFKINGGGTVYFRTGKDPDSPIGITNVRAILCDEGGKYTRYFWDNIQARSSFKQAPILIVTSPYSLNWLYTDFIRKFNSNDPYICNLCDVIQATSAENPYFPTEEYEARRMTMDPRRFNMIYGGMFSKAEGLVYDCFDQDSHICDPFKFPEGTDYYAGVDWGYTDPFVITVRAITPNGMHYRVAEFYRPYMRLTDMVDVAVRLQNFWKIEKFFADPSRPEYIAEFCRNGIRCIPASNDIIPGIEKHYELIKTDRFRIIKGTCPHTIDELETYHYPEEKDLRPDQNANNKNLPVDQHNHTMDAERYCTMGTFTIGIRSNRMIVSNNSELHENIPFIKPSDPKKAPEIDLKIKRTKWENM